MNTFLIGKTCHYLLTSGHKYGHRIHSPFVFDLIQTVFRAKNKKHTFSAIEKRRKELLHNSNVITIEDFGAGSKKNTSNIRKINYIARTSLSQGKYARLLYNLVKRYQPQTILELGTSLAISTSYLALGNPSSKLITLEGSQSIANIAKETLQACGITNAAIQVGRFDDTLDSVLQELKTVDFAFIDGNHTKDATLRYFEKILPYCNEHTILIFDDISWSEDMNDAWNQIVENPNVSISIDVCKQGLVFFRKGIVKQHFVIRY
ncbi:MAG: class I SAM-dependent methyltransferase [Bacteroidales bacterium]|nr:class I SAM-dependent methyltransferase [Bacteroidales bacterium]